MNTRNSINCIRSVSTHNGARYRIINFKLHSFIHVEKHLQAQAIIHDIVWSYLAKKRASASDMEEITLIFMMWMWPYEK